MKAIVKGKFDKNDELILEVIKFLFRTGWSGGEILVTPTKFKGPWVEELAFTKPYICLRIEKYYFRFKHHLPEAWEEFYWELWRTPRDIIKERFENEKFKFLDEVWAKATKYAFDWDWG